MNLGTLYVQLNGDSKAFLGMMSGAGAAVEKFAKETKKLANDVAQTSGMLLGLGGAALALAATVDSRTAKSMDGLKRSTQLLAIQVSDILQPAVASLTEGFRKAADWVAGLSPHVKAQISTWATWAAGIAVASKALAVVASLVSGVAGAFSSAVGAMAAVGAAPILVIVGAIAVAAAGIAALHYAFRTNLGGISDAWKTFADWLSRTAAAAFDGLIKFASAFADGFLANLRDLADGAAKFFDLIGSGENRKKALNLYQALEHARAGLAKNGAKGIVADALALGKAAGTAFVDEWKRILKDMGLPDFKSVLNNGGQARGPSRPGVFGIDRVDAGDVSRKGDLRGQYTVNTRAVINEFFEAPMKAAAEASRGLEDARKKELQARAAINANLEHEAKLLGGKLKGSQMSPEEARKYGTRKQEEQARRAQMTPKELAKDDSAAAAAKWSAVGSIALQGITSAMGEVGSLVQSAAQAIQGGGGIWGAVIAVIMEVVKKTESAMKFVGVAMEFVKQIAAMVEPLVKPIFDALTDVLGTIIAEIGPVFEMLKPFVELIVGSIKNLEPVFSAIGDIIATIEPIVSFIGEMLKSMDSFLAPLLQLLAGIIKVVATVILGILIALNEIAGAFGDQKAKAESKRLRALVDKMWAPGADARNEADHDAAAATLRNAAAQDKAAEAAQKVAESFLNVPTGYKLANARFNAMGPGANQYSGAYGSSSQYAGAIPGATGAGGAPVFGADAQDSGTTTLGGTGGSSGGGGFANADAAYYAAYGDAIAAGKGYAAAVEAGEAARAAWLAAHKGGGGSQKSGGPGMKTAASSGAGVPVGAGVVLMGDVIIYGTDQATLEALLRDAARVAARKRAQQSGTPYSSAKDPTGNIR